MNSPTLYQSLRTGALYRFVAHTNTGTFAWFERQDTGEQVRLRVASLETFPGLLDLRAGTIFRLAAFRRAGCEAPSARQAVGDDGGMRPASTHPPPARGA